MRHSNPFPLLIVSKGTFWPRRYERKFAEDLLRKTFVQLKWQKGKVVLFLLDIVVVDKMPAAVQPSYHHEGSYPGGKAKLQRMAEQKEEGPWAQKTLLNYQISQTLSCPTLGHLAITNL